MAWIDVDEETEKKIFALIDEESPEVEVDWDVVPDKGYDNYWVRCKYAGKQYAFLCSLEYGIMEGTLSEIPKWNVIGILREIQAQKEYLERAIDKGKLNEVINELVSKNIEYSHLWNWKFLNVKLSEDERSAVVSFSGHPCRKNGPLRFGKIVTSKYEFFHTYGTSLVDKFIVDSNEYEFKVWERVEGNK